MPPAKRVRIGGVEYVELLMHISSRDVFNRPKNGALFYDDERTNLVGGEQFMVVYVRADMVKEVTKGTV